MLFLLMLLLHFVDFAVVIVSTMAVTVVRAVINVVVISHHDSGRTCAIYINS